MTCISPIFASGARSSNSALRDIKRTTRSPLHPKEADSTKVVFNLPRYIYGTFQKDPIADMSLSLALGLDGAADLQDFDISVVREFIEFFPVNGLSKVLKGYLSSGISQFPLKAQQVVQEGQENGSVEEEDVPLGSEDCLLLMAVGVYISFEL